MCRVLNRYAFCSLALSAISFGAGPGSLLRAAELLGSGVGAERQLQAPAMVQNRKPASPELRVRRQLFADDFEDGLQRWAGFWTRVRQAGRLSLVKGVGRNRSNCVRIEHSGQQDWSFSPKLSLEVKPGDIISVSAWLKTSGRGHVDLGAIAYEADDKVRDWVIGRRGLTGEVAGREVRAIIVVPEGVVRLVPRLIGSGPGTVWIDEFNVGYCGNVAELFARHANKKLSVSNGTIEVSLDLLDGTLAVQDRRCGRGWVQEPIGQQGLVLEAASAGNVINWAWFVPALDLTVTVRAELAGNGPELVVRMEAADQLPRSLAYPYPFITKPPTYLVIPMNEGISYPVADKTIQPRRLIAYGGHGICMGFWGATDGKAGYMAIIETPDDCSIRILRHNGLLCVAPEWDAQKGRFGYVRILRYVFFSSGGHVAMCKRYRQYAKQIGLLKTLEQKREENPHVDLLIGAVTIWCWERDALAMVKELRAAGIERILWSSRQPPEVIKAMNRMGGILTSRYDIYQDVMNPANFNYLRGVHPDWPTKAWPDDLMIGYDGDWVRGWRVRGKDGKWYPCGVLCDSRAVDYARQRIPPELKTHPYRCRFIDTTTASPWRECYHPKHPMTRTDSKRWKMELLRFVSQQMRLLCGSETGHEAAVPYVHYFEGMLSLGPYRVPDAGRNMMEIWEQVPELVAKFQVGHRYRLPLWELVYHDCVVAQWYWGDYNNKLPAIWDKRDLFNILYGTPPMFMFNSRIWRQNRERFADSYSKISPLARATGYSEMIDHQFLTPDRSVQQTAFANGATITVNFGDRPFVLPDGTRIEPGGYHVAGLK